MKIPTQTRAWFLRHRPTGVPSEDDFSLQVIDLPPLAEGEVLVRNSYLSVDPYMLDRIDEAESYMPSYDLESPLDGAAVGEVIASRSSVHAVGSRVFHALGWREHSILKAEEVFPIDTTLAPESAYLGVLGIPGLTAYVALERFADLKPGDTVYISAAGGAVGSLLGQLAKLRGAGRVIGSVGSSQKVKELKETFGFDEAFNYKDAPIAEQLASIAPEGVDVVFDGVGGEALEAGVGALRIHGRFVIIGMLSQYNTPDVPGPRNLWNLSVTRSSMRAFMVSEEMDLRPTFIAEVADHLASGRVRNRETVVESIEQTPAALLSLMRGGNLGKMVVKL